MKFKKFFLIICLVICLFTMASVCAGEVNDTAISAIDLQDNWQINEYNQVIDKSICADDSINNCSTNDDNIGVSARGTVGNSVSGKLGMTDDAVIGAGLRANVTALNVTAFDNTLFVVDCVDGFNGNVSISIAGNELYNGSVETLIEAAKLPAGDYVATAVFYGDNNYNELTLDNIKFTVSRVTPTIAVAFDDVVYPNKVVANINLGNNANGTVNVIVDGKVFNGTVSGGFANIDLNGLSAGSKVASIPLYLKLKKQDQALELM